MSVIGLGIAGVVAGIVGSEFLRAARPDFVRKVEESARRFVGRLSASETQEKASNDRPEDR